MTSGDFILSGGAALALGFMTAWSPCPLLSNLAALSYILREANRPRDVFIAGSSYTLGRVLTYTVLAAILTAGFLSVPLASYSLQKYFNQLLGPVLVAAGMVLLDWVSLPSFPTLTPGKNQTKGIVGPALWGALFALSFCPVSAALFFGSLLPLCLKTHSIFWLPALYGFATGLPVAFLAFLTALGFKGAAKWLQKTAGIEAALRTATGIIFIFVGVYFCLVHLFGVPLFF